MINFNEAPPLTRGIAKLMMHEVTREVVIQAGVDFLNDGVKIPIGFYRDCRGMGFYNVKWGIELAIELQNED
jgi:hypothetical protein